MRINNINNQNQPNFGLNDVIVVNNSKRLTNLVNSSRTKILRIGVPSSSCYIKGYGIFATARVEIPMGRYGNNPIKGKVRGTAVNEIDLLHLIEMAHAEASKKFMNQLNLRAKTPSHRISIISQFFGGIFKKIPFLQNLCPKQ